MWLRIDASPKPIFLCASYVRPIYEQVHTNEDRKRFVDELDSHVKKFQRRESHDHWGLELST